MRTGRRRNLYDPVVALEEIHSHIHEGIFFSYDTTNIALGATASIEALVVIPSGIYAHSRPACAAGATSRLSIFESPTVTDNGTEVTDDVKNRNRASSSTTTLTVYSGPTVSDDGDSLEDKIIPENIFFEISSPYLEWILKPSTTYLIRLTNLTAQAQAATLSLNWYELGG